MSHAIPSTSKDNQHQKHADLSFGNTVPVAELESRRSELNKLQNQIQAPAEELRECKPKSDLEDTQKGDKEKQRRAKLWASR